MTHDGLENGKAEVDFLRTDGTNAPLGIVVIIKPVIDMENFRRNKVPGIGEQPTSPKGNRDTVKAVFFTCPEESEQIVGVDTERVDLVKDDISGSEIMMEGIAKLSVVGKGNW